VLVNSQLIMLTVQKRWVPHHLEKIIYSHSTSLLQVTDFVVQSLLLPETSYIAKAHRFKIVSEILRFSGQPLPGAWKLRSR
jgi:hypothetical protein